MLTLNGKKMSKSVDNFILPNEIFSGKNKILDKKFTPNVVKFFMYQAHYRSILDISNDALIASEKGLNKLIDGFNSISNLDCSNENSDFNVDNWISNCYSKLNDDFNTPMLIAEIFECLKFINSVKIGNKNLNKLDKEKIKNTFKIFLFEVLALKNIDEKSSIDNKISSDLIELLIKIRNQSRANKNFELSDQIRDDLMSLGVQLNDDKNESSYKMI
jgi:cysteinyl-tRNA synthetase